MFAPRYFAVRYFAPRYWPPGAGLIVAAVQKAELFIANIGRMMNQ